LGARRGGIMGEDHLSELLESFRRRAVVSNETYQELERESGKRLIGYTLGDVPKELIHSAGFLPVGLLGWGQPVQEAAAYLPSFCCSLMRTTLDIGISDGADALSGLILAHICDTTRDFSGIWQRHVHKEFFHDWMPPKQVNRPSARSYILSELSRLKEHLEGFAGHSISDRNLEASFETYETQRSLLKDLRELYSKRSGLLTGIDFYRVLKASLFMDVETFNPLAKQLLKELSLALKEPGNSGVSLVVSGKMPEPLDVIGFVEETGASIVDDDFLWGSRIIRQTLPSQGSPLERMAERFLRAEPFPGYLYEAPARKDFLMKLVETSDADGVIFWNIKFCEPYNFDYPDLKTAFTQKGIPTLAIETEMQPSGIEQLRTRINAFCEALVRKEK
jgi:bcr-type benzoyl-CoA reductase subunit C